MFNGGLLSVLNSGVDIYGRILGTRDASKLTRSEVELDKIRADTERLREQKAIEQTALDQARLNRENSSLYIAFKWIGGAVAASIIAVFVGMAMDQFRKKRK